jgi:hypothetical protein
VIVILADGTVRRSYYNSANCDLSTNAFDNSGAQPGSGGFINELSFTLPGPALYLRLRPYYTSSTVRVDGAGLALQMYRVQANAEGGDAEKEIEVKRTRDAAGSIFDYALFSKTTIIKEL